MYYTQKVQYNYWGYRLYYQKEQKKTVANLQGLLLFKTLLYCYLDLMSFCMTEY